MVFCRPHKVPRTLFGIGIAENVRDDRRAVGSRFKHTSHALQCDPADANERHGANFLLPFLEARQALRRKSHRLQDRRINGSKRDIIRLNGKRAGKFGVVMRGNAQPQTRAPDRGKIGAIKITLPKMDEIAARLDRQLPMIIDDELSPGARAKRPCLGDLGTKDRLRLILDAQLHQPDTTGQESRDPCSAVNDRVEGVKHARGR